MSVDWSALRLLCIGAALKRGCSHDQAEDVAQETVVRVLEHAPANAMGYALVVSDRLAIRVRMGEARMVQLYEDPSQNEDRLCDESRCRLELRTSHVRQTQATQEAHVQAVQLGFLLRVRMPGVALETLDDDATSAGRMVRMRARKALEEVLT